jgi:hypothetical protein
MESNPARLSSQHSLYNVQQTSHLTVTFPCDKHELYSCSFLSTQLLLWRHKKTLQSYAAMLCSRNNLYYFFFFCKHKICTNSFSTLKNTAHTHTRNCTVSLTTYIHSLMHARTRAKELHEWELNKFKHT